MDIGRTNKALAAITDEGLFERLATAVLREADPLYHSLAHPGVNVQGKTIKAPLDGICFIPGSNPPHIIATHHTTTALVGLEKKWLHDPATVKKRKNSKSRQESSPGDILKTAMIVAEKREQMQDLRATLILTTNQEPGLELISAVEAAGRTHNIEIDIWSCSRLAHFLDSPKGQWLRHTYLQIEQEIISPELLHELSKKSLEVYRPYDDKRAWVSRDLDMVLSTALCRDIFSSEVRPG